MFSRKTIASKEIGSEPKQPSTPIASTLTSSSSKEFSIGQAVKIKRPPGKPGYDDGEIRSKHKDGSYTIEYTDGRTEMNVKVSRIVSTTKTIDEDSPINTPTIKSR